MCKKCEDCIFSRPCYRVLVFTVLILILAALLTNISVEYLKQLEKEDELTEGSQIAASMQTVHTVLLWTPVHDSSSGWFLESKDGDYQVNQCFYKCSFTRDRSALSHSSIVLFDHNNIKLSDIPSRSPMGNQLWGLFHPRPLRRDDLVSSESVFFDVLLSYLPQADVQLFTHNVQAVSSSTSPPTINIQKEEQNFKSLVAGLLEGAVDGGKTVGQHIKQSFQSDLTDSEPENQNSRRKRQTSRKLRHHAAIDTKVEKEPEDEELYRNRRAYHYESRLVATILNKCTSHGNREGYIQDLSGHVLVHTYGECGVPCPGNSTADCLQYLAKFYKYFLVFESDICEHYTSDLVWKVLETSMLPVVFGGGDYGSSLPPGSYIDAMPQTPENLAHFLIYLDKNDAVYRTYFKWKEIYRLEEEKWECKLCKLLHSLEAGGFNSLGHFGRKIRGNQLNMDRCTRWPTLQFSIHR